MDASKVVLDPVLFSVRKGPAFEIMLVGRIVIRQEFLLVKYKAPVINSGAIMDNSFASICSLCALGLEGSSNLYFVGIATALPY